MLYPQMKSSRRVLSFLLLAPVYSQSLAEGTVVPSASHHVAHGNGPRLRPQEAADNSDTISQCTHLLRSGIGLRQVYETYIITIPARAQHCHVLASGGCRSFHVRDWMTTCKTFPRHGVHQPYSKVNFERETGICNISFKCGAAQ